MSQVPSESAKVVIIGGGIMGLSIAYHLALLGQTDIVVLDSTYLCGGASGRNGGGIRAQWSSEANVRIMRESIQMCRDFASRMKINVWFRQGGYLFLARTAAIAAQLESSVKLQNSCGLSTRILSPAEAQKVVPELDVSGVVSASYNPDDGVVFPWPFVWGFANAATKLGVRIRIFREVVGFQTRGGQIEGVVHRRSGPPGSSEVRDEETIRTGTVINAAGAWSPEIARMLGVALPNKPHRHEICSTEPLKLWLKPLVADLSDGLYFSQSTRGEIVGGIGQSYVPHGINHDSSHAFLGKYARSLVRACPVLADVKVLRQWSGSYDLTPDANPIMGDIDGVSRFYQVNGFMGHGFMMAPVIGKQVAEHLVSGDAPPMFEKWNFRRFAEGKLLSEAMIIG